MLISSNNVGKVGEFFLGRFLSFLDLRGDVSQSVIVIFYTLFSDQLNLVLVHQHWLRCVKPAESSCRIVKVWINSTLASFLLIPLQLLQENVGKLDCFVESLFRGFMLLHFMHQLLLTLLMHLFMLVHIAYYWGRMIRLWLQWTHFSLTLMVVYIEKGVILISKSSLFLDFVERVFNADSGPYRTLLLAPIITVVIIKRLFEAGRRNHCRLALHYLLGSFKDIMVVWVFIFLH